MKYYTADLVYPIVGPAIKNGIVAMNAENIITGIHQPGEIDTALLESYKGALIPGFINSHCHLELSHMLGAVPQKTGLPKFLTHIMNNRGKGIKKQDAAMVKADKLMYANGIQAVGDHVNSGVSAQVKKDSPIRYHTFVEIFARRNEDIFACIDQAREIEFHFDYKHASITPHAPYSGTKELFKNLKKSITEDNIISIHNQESDEENKLFRYKSGEFLDFFAQMGIQMDSFKAQARNSLQTYLPYIPNKNKLILVHNTYTTIKDVDFVGRMAKNVYFCFCPKANLYIENRLPKIGNFLTNNEAVILGTDSLASNDTLDILEELKVLHQEFPHLEFNDTIKWATLNGAKALNLDQTLGSLEVGKSPGLILLEGMSQGVVTPNIKVKRIR